MLALLALKNVFLDMVISTFMARHEYDCLTECFWSKTCKSFLFDQNSKRCYFCDKIFTGNQSLVTVESGINYYEYVTPLDITYEAILGIRYKIHPEKKSWTNARQVCQAEGGDLAMPKTATQRYFYMSLLYSGMFHQDFFFGATDHTGAWTWVDGTSATDFNVRYTNRPVQHCLEFDKSRTFYAESCDTEFQPFVCEYP